MKRIGYFCILVTFFIIACNSDKKVDPLWGMWTLQSSSPVKTEIMFNDDYTGFVFVADTVQFETSWQQDSLLNVAYFDMTSGKKSLGIRKSYSFKIDGDVLILKDCETGEDSKYMRFVE